MSQKINTMCSCKNLKCKIHGNCKECIDHHKEHGQPHCKRPENLEAVKGAYAPFIFITLYYFSKFTQRIIF